MKINRNTNVEGLTSSPTIANTMLGAGFRVLVACEESDEVRGRFEAVGFDAWSCDLQPNRNPKAKHYQGNVFDIINDGWDAMIAFPPCTHLAVSGARHFEAKRKDGRQQQGIDFFMAMINAPIKRIAVENPMGIMSTIYRKPTQIIQPYYFGDADRKTTCLWLKNLPPLYHNAKPNLFDDVVTHVEPELITTPKGDKLSKWHYDSYKLSNEDKSKMRSKTFPAIAEAIVKQWGAVIACT